MLGPVYTLEWQQAIRRAQQLRWRWVYVGILAIELAALLIEAFTKTILEPKFAEFAVIAESAFLLFLAQQTIAILIAAPAFAAGSISDERQRGTLDFLLMTPLSSGEIIVGKWLGQATQALYLVSPGYIVLALLSALLGDGARSFYWPMAEQIAILYALTALSQLLSLWSQSTARAIIGVYAFLAFVVAAQWLLDVPMSGPNLWLSHIHERISIPAIYYLRDIGGLALLTIVSLSLSIWRLRPAYEKHRAGSRTLGRWWDRPPIADAPMRWKERFIGDWTSIPVWRHLPRWVRYGVVSAAVILVVAIWPQIECFMLLSVVQLLASGLFVAIRAAGAITSERENQTWDSLLTTHLDAYQIVRGKLWGQIDAVQPYLFAYIAPAVITSCWIEPLILPWIILLWLASWVLLYLSAPSASASRSARQAPGAASSRRSRPAPIPWPARS